MSGKRSFKMMLASWIGFPLKSGSNADCERLWGQVFTFAVLLCGSNSGDSKPAIDKSYETDANFHRKGLVSDVPIVPAVQSLRSGHHGN